MSSAPNDLASFWMPFTDNRGFKRDPRMFSRAKDMHYETPDGRQVLDGTSGLWCVNAGHGRPKIVEAIQKAAAEIDYAPQFQLGYPPSFKFASRLAELLPAPLDRIFFANSGSESVDTALKIALTYQRAIGQGTRTRLIGRARGYHGVGFGGISVGGIVGNRRMYPQLPGSDHLSHTFNLAENAYSRGMPKWGAHLADELEGLVALHGAETIAAVVVEPMAGSTGVLPPPVGYLEKLREITKKHGILLIFDEVISGFGRFGTNFAADYFGVIPDMITMAKGLTNGAAPMGAVAASTFIYDTILEKSGPGIELPHGYTYTGHPLAVAAGLATLDTYAEEGLFENAKALSAYWEDAVHSMKGLPHIIDIRNLGIVAGIELASRPDVPVGTRSMELFRRCFDAGLLIRVTGDIIALSPPLMLNKGHIDEIVGKLSDELKKLD